MTKVKADLRTRIADALGQSSVDQVLPAEDAAKIDEAIDDLFAELREMRLCWWTENAIPNACMIALTMAGAAIACAKFGKSNQGYESGLNEGQRRLRILRNPATHSPMAPDYF